MHMFYRNSDKQIENEGIRSNGYYTWFLRIAEADSADMACECFEERERERGTILWKSQEDWKCKQGG